MTKEEFLVLINGASFIAFKFAEQYVKNKLKPEFRYDVHLNVSHDDTNLDDFDIYPEDNNRIEKGLTDKEVRELLYRNGKIPVWVDIAVHKADKNITTFQLLCAGRYSDDDEKYYYQKGGTGPFGIKSPYLPIGYKEGKKFRLKK